jgi:hypothetical protein
MASGTSREESMTRARLLILGILALLVIAAAPFLGTWVLVAGAVLILLAAVSAGRGAIWISLATALGLLGGLAGAASALAALRAHAGDPLYTDRTALGLAALVLALAVAASSLLIPPHPRLAAALLIPGSLLGFSAINLYDINTLYILILPTCWLAAVLALAARPSAG